MSAKGNIRIMLFAVPLAFFLFCNAGAEELKLRIATYIATHEIKPVGDIEGHIAGPYLRRGLIFLDSGEVGLFRSTGTIDLKRGKGSVESESTYLFEDGSTMIVGVNGKVESRPGGGLIYHNLTGRSVRGTGRYEGISGSATAKGKGLTPFGEETRSDAFFDVVVTYTRKSK